MSNTSVKVKASSAHKEVKPSALKTVKGANASDHKQDKSKSVAISEAVEDKTQVISSAASTVAKDASSTFDGISKKVRSYLDEHGHAAMYGVIGLVAAILILTIGFLPVLLLAVFAAIGVAVGKFRDSGMSMSAATKSLAKSLHR